MPKVTIQKIVSGLNVKISNSVVREADAGSTIDVSVPASKSGTLTVRTDNETGSLTLGSGHGITTAQIVDLYWTGGARRGVLVGTVAGTTVPIGADNGGIGDNLPAQGTDIVVAPRVEVTCQIEPDDLALLAVYAPFDAAKVASPVSVEFFDDGDTSVVVLSLEPNFPVVYDITGGGDANPLAGDPIAKLLVSNGSATSGLTLTMVWLEDATP